MSENIFNVVNKTISKIKTNKATKNLSWKV